MQDTLQFNADQVSIVYVPLYAPSVVAVSATNSFGISDMQSLVQYGLVRHNHHWLATSVGHHFDVLLRLWVCGWAQTNTIRVTGVSGAAIHHALWDTLVGFTGVQSEFVEIDSIEQGFEALLAGTFSSLQSMTNRSVL